MGIERQPSSFFKGYVLDELVAMDYSRYSSRPLAVESEGDGVMMEDVDSKSWSDGGEMVEVDQRG